MTTPDRGSLTIIVGHDYRNTPGLRNGPDLCDACALPESDHPVPSGVVYNPPEGDTAMTTAPEGCEHDSHAIHCQCHQGGPIVADIPPAVGESPRQRQVLARHRAQTAQASRVAADVEEVKRAADGQRFGVGKPPRLPGEPLSAMLSESDPPVAPMVFHTAEERHDAETRTALGIGDPAAWGQGSYHYVADVGEGEEPIKNTAWFCDHAKDIIGAGGQRRADYGDALDSFEQIAKLWSVVLGIEVSAEQVALCQALLKMGRLLNKPNHVDSWVDIIGYAALGGDISQRPGRHM